MIKSRPQTDTPVWQRIFWASSTGIVAIALLMSGGLGALQTATIASALPFSVILLIAIWGLLKALNIDSTKRVLKQQSATHYSRQQQKTGGWQRRLRSMAMFPRRSHVKRFIDEVVMPSFAEIAVELRKQGYTVEVISDEVIEDILDQYEQHMHFLHVVR